MRLKSTALHAALGLSYHVRAPVLWDALRGVRVTILMYHGIPSRDRFEGVVNHYGYNVPEREFDHHLQYLQKHCNVISLRDLLAERGLSRIKTNGWPRKLSGLASPGSGASETKPSAAQLRKKTLFFSSSKTAGSV